MKRTIDLAVIEVVSIVCYNLRVTLIHCRFILIAVCLSTRVLNEGIETLQQ